MALTMVLRLLAIGCFYAAGQWRGDPERRGRALACGAIALAALGAAAYVWMTRPGFDEIEQRVEAALKPAGETSDDTGDDTGEGSSGAATEGTLICTLDPDRSRVTGARTDDVEFDWSANGCVNGRTQYGQNGDEWARVFVPDDEAAVAVNVYDPETRTFRTDRYLLGQRAMAEARTARGQYKPPACGVSDAAKRLGEAQSRLVSLLPERPNERLVYSCRVSRSPNSL
jgi:hypothetical protein